MAHDVSQGLLLAWFILSTQKEVKPLEKYVLPKTDKSDTLTN